MTQKELLRTLYKKYNLIYDETDPTSKDNDVFKHKHFTIITRSGIEKIQKAAGIKIKYTPVYVSDTTVVLKANGAVYDPDTNEPLVEVETFASANDETTNSKYYAEMAEKRAMSRVVLKLAGLYELGVFGQDEISDNDGSKEGSAGIGKRAAYKTG